LGTLLSAEQAAALIQNGWTVACAGFVGAGHAEAVTSALEHRYITDQQPRDLTLVYSAGQGDRGNRGVNHFGHAGLTRRIIGGHWRSAPKLSALALSKQAQAFNLPQGVITHLYRAIAGGKPGVITRVGLHTFVDPRHSGGRLNDLPEDSQLNPPLVKLIELDGQEYLHYLPFNIDCTLLRGTSADADGNIACDDEAFHHELLAIAQAAKNSGGIVIAQVKHISAKPAAPNLVRVPGILVDYIVVVGEDPELHAMTFAEYSNPSYTAPAPGTAATPTTTQKASKVVHQGDFQFQPVALNARIVAQRRAALEIAKHAPKIVNLGVGMPAAIGAVALAAGINGFVLTLESGPIGGTPADGLSFGASAYPQAIIDQPSQFDFYDGGGIDLAMLGIGEFDIKGNVNVSVFGQGANRIIAGVGGFINITQSTRKLVFVGTLTSGGLEIEVSNGAMRIVREGKNRKLVSAVEHLSFNASYVASLGTTMTYITERAVFELGTDGVLQITEIAQGVDLEKDVLALCPKGVTISKHLKMFDPKVLR
jgi:propionate CoA-transferase